MNQRLFDKRRLLDILWLALLILLVSAIQPTFHGDEPMQIYMSGDYATAFLDGNPAALLTQPPYPIDSDAHLRLLNGSVHRYVTGFFWHLAGISRAELPVRPGWDWGLDYATNVATGHYPSARMLEVARFVSAGFLSLSILVMFGFGWRFGNRWLAWLVSGLYTINPLILLNGRRAMQEGELLFFGTLVVFTALLISQRRSENKSVSLWHWLALILTGGLTLASKHSGIVFVAGAFGWVFLAEAVRGQWRAFLLTCTKLALAGIGVILVFVALSPALWSDPPARIANLLEARTEMVNIQVSADPLAPTTLLQRIEGIITQPFMTPPQHFEVASWADFPEVVADVSRYMASPLSGVQFGVFGGALLTLLAGVGIAVSLRRDWRIGVLAWLLVTVASLLANPLPWQRYYLPLIPVMTLLAGIGIDELSRRFVPRVTAAQPEPTNTPAGIIN